MFGTNRRWSSRRTRATASRPLLTCLIAVAVVACLLGCKDVSTTPETKVKPAAKDKDAVPPNSVANDSPKTDQRPSHVRMLRVLAAAAAADKANPWTGTDSLNECLAELRSAQAAGDVRLAMILSVELAEEYTQQGDPDKALRLIEAAEKYAEQLKLPAVGGGEVYEYLYYTHALAAFRKAEDENCIHCTDGEGCLFPISEKGVHERREGATEAIEYLERILKLNPNNASAIWLLNIAHMTLGTFPSGVPEQYRIAEANLKSAVEFPRFRNVATDRGIDTLSLSGGAVVEDFDGDGHLDFLVSSWNMKGQLRFFRGNGDGTFDQRTEQSNLTGITGGLNLAQGDYDNDGDMDVLVLRGAWLGPKLGAQPNSLLSNDGQGRFEDVTFDAGLGDAHFPTQTAAFGDFDNDGDLDLYVGNESLANQLFVNDGKGQFKDLASAAGVADEGFCKGVAWGDIDGDRLIDLYVSNLSGQNRLYHNNGDGTFSEEAKQRGVGDSNHSFATWFWDYDNDGDEDLMSLTYNHGLNLLVADYLSNAGRFGLDQRGEADYLFENEGTGEFRDVGPERGFVRTSQTMGCNFGDLDNDGFLDFYLGTGYPALDAVMPNIMYRNDSGKMFVDVTTQGGFGHLQKGHGVAFADFDEDGDQDVLIELGGAYTADLFHNALFENPGFGNRWLKVRLRGMDSNRYGVGAKIKIVVQEHGKQREIHRTVGSDSSFGGNPLMQEIGLGQATAIDRLEVYWPATDRRQTLLDVPMNQRIEITESDHANKPADTDQSD